MARESVKLQSEDLLITPELYKREPRTASLERELSAYHELSTLMAVDASSAIQRFLDLALELCPAAGSAGLSELGEEPDGSQLFRWTAMSGAFTPYVGGTTPRDFSPCGLCLDAHHTILVDRPARVFTYFNEAEPEIAEGLIVPLYDTGKRPIGTLWVASHESDRKFDPTDARIMEQLAVQLVLAIKLRRKAALMVQLEEVARDREVLVQEVRHRVKNMIQMTSSLLQLQARTVESTEARSALREAQSRLMVLASVYEALLKPDADAREVDVAALIEALVRALRETSPRGGTVTIRTECAKLLLPVGDAVPIGLVVNEAVTNALKYAYPPDERGSIDVRLSCTDGECLLEIKDGGKGFETAMRDGSLGMRLMKNLARQLRAKLKVEGSDGTLVRLEWSRPAEARHEAEVQTLQARIPAAE